MAPPVIPVATTAVMAYPTHTPVCETAVPIRLTSPTSQPSIPSPYCPLHRYGSEQPALSGGQCLRRREPPAACEISPSTSALAPFFAGAAPFRPECPFAGGFAPLPAGAPLAAFAPLPFPRFA